MAIGLIGRIGAKLGIRAGGRFFGRASAKVAGKGVVRLTARQSLRRLGLGAGIGAIGIVGISGALGGGGFFNAINPFSADFNLLIFGVVAVALIAFFALFRR